MNPYAIHTSFLVSLSYHNIIFHLARLSLVFVQCSQPGNPFELQVWGGGGEATLQSCEVGLQYPF